MKIQFPAQITKVETTADKGLRIKMVTPELSGADKTTLFNYGESQIWCALDETAIDTMDVPDYVPDFKGEKSPSERMKAVLYLVGRKLKTNLTDRQFYEAEMEKIINHYKSKLD